MYNFGILVKNNYRRCKLMKKYFSNKYINRRKVLEFLDSKGFYIVLFLCICIVTATAYVVTKRSLSSYIDNVTPTQIPKVAVVDDKPANSTSTANNANTYQYTPSGLKAQSKVAVQVPEKPNKPVQPKITSISMPVIGEFIKEYAIDSLIYSNTLEQWTTHEGVDISADRGSPVKSACDGVVADIYNDSKYGITIVIDSGSGIKIKYSNLSTDSMVKKGAKVKTGDVISGVGSTAIFESGEPSHLHLEVLLNDKNVNPRKYLK